MPAVFRVISVIGVVAMLWVGGHLLIANLHEVGWHLPHDLVHGVTHAVHAPGFVTWLIDSGLSAVFGLAWGAVAVVGVSLGRRLLHLLPHRR
jgi:predicted DNA repair protein MutK